MTRAEILTGATLAAVKHELVEPSGDTTRATCSAPGCPWTASVAFSVPQQRFIRHVAEVAATATLDLVAISTEPVVISRDELVTASAAMFMGEGPGRDWNHLATMEPELATQVMDRLRLAFESIGWRVE